MNAMPAEPVLIAGAWRAADAVGSFRAANPLTGESLAEEYPVSSRKDVDAALAAGAAAAEELLDVPAARRADFLETYAAGIEARAEEIASRANQETALPFSPRLRDVELPRTANQLRQAAAAVRDGSWVMATIDTKANIRSRYGPLGGPVAIFGPNNFPLAFNGVSGGDFAAAIAAGNPVIAKAHTSHPATSRLLAELAFEAVRAAGLPAATVQLLYRLSHEDGEYLVSHPRIAATGYTGARETGLVLKAAADAAGKPIYLELSSVNPVFLLRGALRERLEDIAGQYVTSVLMGTGQFCTNPGIVVLEASAEAEAFIAEVKKRFEAAEPGPLLNAGVASRLAESVAALAEHGAEVVTGGRPLAARGYRFANTLLRATGAAFLDNPRALQREAFGNAGLAVVARDGEEVVAISRAFDGNLTGCVYSHSGGEDDALYARIARHLRRRVGRLLNDKMPTGVAVSAAMNHGGPFPATGHPGFTAVGIPGSIRRFAMLECYDNVREHRLPPELRDRNPDGARWRFIDGAWTQRDVGA
jgi:NADP-dependent aldehyde dehydrogenase